MATLAWIFSKPATREKIREDVHRMGDGRYLLRPMPNETIHVFVKKIDNTRVVKEADPKSSVSCWKTIGTACLAAVAIVGLIVPIADSYLAGYSVTEMDREINSLRNELDRLSAREAQLTSPTALAVAARNQVFVDPTPESMVVLNNERAGTVAMNQQVK